MTDTLTRLGRALGDRYHLDRELGQGGMATVYLAEDIKHGRKVAIKVLHPELSAVIGGDRFLTEIKVTANLQHAHILGLIDSGEADGLLYYVMPYIAGESLRNRLSREKQLPVDDAIRLSKEVASALDYAHRHGVVHRDIKPENILLQEGSALVADFGIALAVRGSRMTQTGMSLGTPAYMSPEQAMGERDIGARSDVYALGAMTYEMLAGEPPFMGPNSQAIVAKVLTESPRPMRPARPSVPPAVEHAVLTALQKLPADRFGSAKEFADALDGKGGHYAATVALSHPERSEGSSRPSRLSRLSRPVILAALALTAAAAGAAGWFIRGTGRASAPAATFSITIPADRRITPFADPGVALSSDGRLLLYNADANGVAHIYARRLTDAVATELAGTEGALGPVFSPDDKWILFTGPGNVWKKMPSQGGAAVDIPIPAGVTVGLMRWNQDDGFAVTLMDNGALALLHSSGAMTTVALPDTSIHEQGLDVMQVLPDGNLLVIGTDVYPAGHALIIDRRTGKRTPLLDVRVSWLATASGHLVWADPVGVLFAAPFDGKRITGAAHGLGATAQTTRGSRPRVAVGRNAGALVYVPAQQATLARVGRDGRIETLLSAPRTYHNPQVSPDGRQVLLDIAGTERDVWRLDLADTTLNRLTFEASGHDALWSPDGTRIIFGVTHGGLIGVYARAADGAGTVDSIDTEGPQLSVHTITPDGQTGIAAKVVSVAVNGFDLMTVPLTGADRRAKPLLTSRYMEGYPALSRDGRWLAYVGDESGRSEVYVRAYPGMGGKVVVSQNGGSEPVWSRDGRELFYIGLVNGAPHLVAAQVETTPQFRVVSRTALFPYADFETATPHANYDVMPDGRSFLMVNIARASEFTYLQNWPALLQSQVSNNP